MVEQRAADPAPTGLAEERIATVPNAVSCLRLLLVPVFAYLILTRNDTAALAVLMVSGATDYLDGYLARRLNQESALGRILDPAADRLYILCTLLGLAWREVVPWWLVAGIVARDVLLAAALPSLRARGYSSLPVHYLGKAATFNLLYAFPLILLGEGDGALAAISQPVGWAFAWWGAALYWWAGVLYVRQWRHLVREVPPR